MSSQNRRMSRGGPARRAGLPPFEQTETDESTSLPQKIKKRLSKRLSGPARRVATPNSAKRQRGGGGGGGAGGGGGSPNLREFPTGSTRYRVSSTLTTSDASNTTSTSSTLPFETPKKERPWRQSDFKIGSALGRGKYGYVYSAVENESRRQIALKVLPKNQITAGGAAALLQLRREVQIHSRLQHPNVCELLGFFTDSKHAYMVLEKCDKGHLYSELCKKGKFENNVAVSWTKQLMLALKYIHDRHVIHRDVKPENLLVHGSTLKLADFGWAVHVPGHHDEQRTTMCGSPAYCSPEIVDGRPHGRTTDLWSLGEY